MIKKYKGFIIFFYAFCAAALIAGAFADLQLDIALNSPENPVAVWFYYTGEIPCRLICPLAGAVLFYFCEKRVARAAGLLLEMGGSAYLGYYISKYFFTGDFKTAYGIVWGIGFGIVLLFVFKYINVPGEYKKILTALAVIGVAVMAVQLSLVECLKYLWGRVRFRDLLAAGSYDAFTAWYIPNGLNGNKSFPSGHTAGAAMSFLIMLFPAAFCKWERHARLCCAGAFIYTAIVGVTRLVMGAHYLSDIAMGAVIGFSCVLVGIKVFEKYVSKLCPAGAVGSGLPPSGSAVSY
ncbi:MAG: phosphatase PAP2 family protein [Clostridiales bacterium]|nr:phosphatase PAP2 family protein [Clostridiales bacterium]